MEKLKNELQRLLTDCKVLFHKDLVTDIVDIFKNTGNAKKFLRIFETRLKIMSEMKESDYLSQSGFEILKGENTGGMRSIRIHSEHNIRILYNYDKKSDRIVLLAFDEREGKVVSSYKLNIYRALSRLEELDLGKK
ncbi:MAG: hypothetical protein LBU94_00580 [Clostridiales bacterium]|jgi:mRNA-degrading endonuclease RelE of RelBE toxin-antitoxin system|nr:hypothetical protein [Clostridiales bacterium]